MANERQILNYEVTGQGPVMVLLHGYLSSLRYWDELRTTLARDHTVIAIDLLGFGNSPKPRRSDYGYDEHIEWLRRTITHAGGDGPITLVGHSMGALLALRYATNFPDRVGRLVLLNTPLFKGAWEARQQLAGTNIFFRASVYWQLHRLIVPVMRIGVMKALLRCALPLKYKGMETYVFSSCVQARVRSMRNVIEAQDSLQELEHISLPVTLVQGRQERPKYLENLFALPKRTDLSVILTNTGHHTPLDAPEMISELLCEVK